MFFKKKSYEAICIGSISKDIFFPTDEGIIIETPEDITAKEKVAFELGGKYRVRDRYEAVGGVAANVAIGLSRLGRKAACYSKVGKDEMGHWAKRIVRNEGVSTETLFIDENAKTDLSAIIVLTQNGERTIFHNRDANEKLEIFEEKLRNTKWLFVSALNGDWKRNMGKILEYKEAFGLRLAFNPGQHNIKDDAALVFRTVRQADVLLLNKDEAIELVMQSPEKFSRQELDNERFLLEALHEAGAKTIGMTDGKRGAWGFDGKEYWHCPIHTRKSVVDSTGCGDAFGSGFFAAWLRKRPLDVALRFGIGNSGSVVGFYGASQGLLRAEEMENIIQEIIPQRLG
jgi:sugar/nucleoside kinase (ribokinase family)